MYLHIPLPMCNKYTYILIYHLLHYENERTYKVGELLNLFCQNNIYLTLNKATVTSLLFYTAARYNFLTVKLLYTAVTSYSEQLFLVTLSHIVNGKGT